MSDIPEDLRITFGLTNSFVTELLQGIHDLSSDQLMCALYGYDNYLEPTNKLDATATAYTTSYEASGPGYSAGGVPVSYANTPSVQDTATGIAVELADISTTGNSTISAIQALIYNASKSQRAVAWINFGTLRASTNQVFTIKWDRAHPPLINIQFRRS